MQEKKIGSKNWLMKKFREYHIWLGIAMSIFILLVSFTGIYLNHQDFFNGARKEYLKKSSTDNNQKTINVFSTSTDLKKIPVSFEKAMNSALGLWGNVDLEKIELKKEKESLVFKIKTMDGREIIMSPETGRFKEKNGYILNHPQETSREITSELNWGKIFKDIHTGKILGGWGKLFVDLVALIIIGLVLTGVYIWWLPKYRK